MPFGVLYCRRAFFMPRKPRQSSDAGVYHFINRGVNKKQLFHKDQDYKHYLKLMAEYSRALEVQIYHYCLMNNHTHILLKSPDIESLSRFGHFIQRCYAYYYCKTYHWAEQVFRKRFVSIPIDKSSYLLECGRYIERNPVRAKVVDNLKDFSYSSFAYYGLGNEDLLITPDPLYLDLGSSQKQRIMAYKDYVTADRPYEEIVDQVLVPL